MKLADAIVWANNANACDEALDALDAIDVQAELEGVDAWDMLISWDELDVASWLCWFTRSTYRRNKTVGFALNAVYYSYLAKLHAMEALDRNYAAKEPRKAWFAAAAAILRDADPLLV